MAHPMGPHGHRLQVVPVEGWHFWGAMPDTAFMAPTRSVTIALDANNPDPWAFHSHHLCHLATGTKSLLVSKGLLSPRHITSHDLLAEVPPTLRP